MKSKPKIIFVEGIPGTGKSTTSEYIDKLLNEMNISHQFYQEGHNKHPIVRIDGTLSFLTGHDYNNILSKYEKYEPLLVKHTTKILNYFCIDIEPSNEEAIETIPKELINDLFENHLYTAPLDVQKEAFKKRWIDFIFNVKYENRIFIFDCSLLQNPVITLLAHNKDKNEIIDYLLSIIEVIKGAQSAIIYLDKKDVDKTIQTAINERAESWKNKILEFSKYPYGQERKLKGLNAFINICIDSNQIQHEFLAAKKLNHKVFDVSDCNIDRSQKEIKQYIKECFK